MRFSYKLDATYFLKIELIQTNCLVEWRGCPASSSQATWHVMFSYATTYLEDVRVISSKRVSRRVVFYAWYAASRVTILHCKFTNTLLHQG